MGNFDRLDNLINFGFNRATGLSGPAPVRRGPRGQSSSSQRSRQPSPSREVGRDRSTPTARVVLAGYSRGQTLTAVQLNSAVEAFNAQSGRVLVPGGRGSLSPGQVYQIAELGYSVSDVQSSSTASLSSAGVNNEPLIVFQDGSRVLGSGSSALRQYPGGQSWLSQADEQTLREQNINPAGVQSYGNTVLNGRNANEIRLQNGNRFVRDDNGTLFVATRENPNLTRVGNIPLSEIQQAGTARLTLPGQEQQPVTVITTTSNERLIFTANEEYITQQAAAANEQNSTQAVVAGTTLTLPQSSTAFSLAQGFTPALRALGPVAFAQQLQAGILLNDDLTLRYGLLEVPHVDLNNLNSLSQAARKPLEAAQNALDSSPFAAAAQGAWAQWMGSGAQAASFAGAGASTTDLLQGPLAFTNGPSLPAPGGAPVADPPSTNTAPQTNRPQARPSTNLDLPYTSTPLNPAPALPDEHTGPLSPPVAAQPLAQPLTQPLTSPLAQPLPGPATLPNGPGNTLSEEGPEQAPTGHRNGEMPPELPEFLTDLSGPIGGTPGGLPPNDSENTEPMSLQEQVSHLLKQAGQVPAGYTLYGLYRVGQIYWEGLDETQKTELLADIPPEVRDFWEEVYSGSHLRSFINQINNVPNTWLAGSTVTLASWANFLATGEFYTSGEFANQYELLTERLGGVNIQNPNPDLPNYLVQFMENPNLENFNGFITSIATERFVGANARIATLLPDSVFSGDNGRTLGVNGLRTIGEVFNSLSGTPSRAVVDGGYTAVSATSHSFANVLETGDWSQFNPRDIGVQIFSTVAVNSVYHGIRDNGQILRAARNSGYSGTEFRRAADETLDDFTNFSLDFQDAFSALGPTVKAPGKQMINYAARQVQEEEPQTPYQLPPLGSEQIDSIRTPVEER